VGVRHDGTVFVVTDNDGVDGSSGETVFRRLGKPGACSADVRGRARSRGPRAPGDHRTMTVCGGVG